MPPRRFLKLFLLFLTILWIGGIGLVFHYFSLLDEYDLAGVFIIALIFVPMMILGSWLEVPEQPTWPEARRVVLKFVVVFTAVFLGFCGGLWVVLRLLRAIWPTWLPLWLEMPVYIILMSWYVAGLLKVYWWLAKRIQAW